MREKFKEYSDRLIQNLDREGVYKDLQKIFCECCMFHEEGACYEKLWHLTQEHDLYKKVGDVFANKVGNFDVALQAYNRYIQYKDNDFYQNYMRVGRKLGYTAFTDDIDNEDYTKEIIRLCDSYDAIVYMMICLCQKKDYEGVIELDEKLSVAFDMVNNYISEYNSIGEQDYLKDNHYSRKHLSEILSQVQHRNDINMLAIKYDRENKQAYFNIIADYITYKNFDEALSFYNNDYCETFELSRKDGIVDICWVISDFYRDKYDFYNAVLFQKFALEQDVAGV